MLILPSSCPFLAKVDGSPLHVNASSRRRLPCSSKSRSTPLSANLMIISNIVNYPVLGGINLTPPHIGQIATLFIVSDLVNYPVRGDLHEGPVTSAASTCHHFDQGTFLCYSHQSISLSFRLSALHCHFERAFPCHFDQAKPSLCHFERAQRVEKSIPYKGSCGIGEEFFRDRFSPNYSYSV